MSQWVAGSLHTIVEFPGFLFRPVVLRVQRSGIISEGLLHEIAEGVIFRVVPESRALGVATTFKQADRFRLGSSGFQFQFKKTKRSAFALQPVQDCLGQTEATR